MRLTKRVRTIVLVALLPSIVGITVAAGHAGATPARPAATHAPASPAGQVTPNASDTLFFCDYNIASDNIAVWEWPGGAGRSGNHVFVRVRKNIGFNSIPWISSGVVNGQRWIYGAALVVDALGHIEDLFGWVGKNFLTTPRCDKTGFQTSNSKLSGTHKGDDFVSKPNMVSPSFRGQTWVWGVDPFASNRAGWVGRTWLTLRSCSGGQCFYTVKAPNINIWLLPGGGSGP
jgi:hypothetical protein